MNSCFKNNILFNIFIGILQTTFFFHQIAFFRCYEKREVTLINHIQSKSAKMRVGKFKAWPVKLIGASKHGTRLPCSSLNYTQFVYHMTWSRNYF